MRDDRRARTWVDRIVMVVLIGVGVVVGGTILLTEVVGVEVGTAVEPVLAVADLSVSQVILLSMGALLAVVGVVIVVTRGLPAFVRAATLASKDPVAVGDLHLESGAVEVEGTAEAMDGYGTLQSPYSGTESLGFRYEEKQRDRRTSGEDTWKTVDSGARAVPFTVTDESGSVVVDPGAATLTFDRDVVASDGGHRKYEWRLEPGESVYVSGRKRDGTDDPDAPGDAETYVGPGDDASSFTVSDAGETRTVLRFVAKGAVFSVGGLLLLGAGIGLLAFGGL